MGGFSWLLRRPAAAGDPTHALFAAQSHSIVDNLVALLRGSRAWNCSAVGCGSCYSDCRHQPQQKSPLLLFRKIPRSPVGSRDCDCEPFARYNRLSHARPPRTNRQLRTRRQSGSFSGPTMLASSRKLQICSWCEPAHRRAGATIVKSEWLPARPS